MEHKKLITFAGVVLVLYILGRMLGVEVGELFVSEAEEETNGEVVNVKVGKGFYAINLDEFRDDQIPKTVKMVKVGGIPVEGSDEILRLNKGDELELLNIKDGKLIVAKSGANAKGTIDASETDLRDQLAKQLFREDVTKLGGTIAGGPVAPAPAPAPMPTPTPVVTPTPTPTPTPVAAVTPTPMPTPTPTPVIEPTPTPTPTSTGGAKLSDDELIALMKESIAGGAVKEFTSDQVKAWKATGDETIDGTDYQTGLAAYEAATIFGVRPVQAKALIKDGKVERWVYAKSGMEIQ